MTKIKSFSEFEKTNEIFGKFAFELGKTLGGLYPKDNTRITPFQKSVNTKVDNSSGKELGKEILIKLRERTKNLLLSFLRTRSDDFQKVWSKEYADDFIESEMKKQKKPNNQWPDIWDNGIIDIDKVVDYIYKKGTENELEWSYVYVPQTPSPENNIHFQANDRYSLISNFNGDKLVEITKVGNKIRIFINERKKPKSLDSVDRPRKTTFKSRDTISGYKNAPLVSPGFIVDEDTKSELSMETSLSNRIFSEAERVYSIIKETSQKNAIADRDPKTP